MEHGIMVLDEDEDMKEQSALMISNYSQNIQSTPQVNFIHAIQTLPDLGLKLSITQSFLDKLDQLVQRQNSIAAEQANTNFEYATARTKLKDTLQQVNKMKAENFPISLLRIGSWQRVSKNEGDLVAKCYFAKRKLVWEFLENGLKSKIEIQWYDILSLKAVMQENQPGILEIELNQPPTFHNEIDPQPRKHTQWRMVSDFTGGQALVFRRHHLEFPPGALDKPLEKLLRCDSRLFQLSRQGYPTLESPHFQKHTFGIDFSFDYSGQEHVNPEQHQFSCSNVPTHYLSQNFQTYAQKAQKSLNSDSPISDEHISNQTPLWSQGMNNARDSLITNQVGGMSFTVASASQVNSTLSLQNNHMTGYVQEAMTTNQLGGLVSTPSISQVHPPGHVQEAMTTNQFGGLVSTPSIYQVHPPGHVQEAMTTNQLGGLVSTPCISQVHPTLISLQEAEAEAGRQQQRFQILNGLQNMLLNNPQTEFSNDIAEDNLFRGHHTNSICNVTTNYGQNMVTKSTSNVTTNYGQNMVDNIVVMNNNLSSRLIYPQAASWSQSEVLRENMSMNLLSGNNSFYSSDNSDPIMEYFFNFNQ